MGLCQQPATLEGLDNDRTAGRSQRPGETIQDGTPSGRAGSQAAQGEGQQLQPVSALGRPG